MSALPVKVPRCEAKVRHFFNAHAITGRRCQRSLMFINPDGELVTVSIWDPESGGPVCWNCSRDSKRRGDFLLLWPWLADRDPSSGEWRVPYEPGDTEEGRAEYSREARLFRHALSDDGRQIKTGFARTSWFRE